MPSLRRRRRASYRRRRTVRRRPRRSIGRRHRRRNFGKLRRYRQLRGTVVRNVNYLGDRAIIKIRTELQFNHKQLNTGFGTSTIFPGNYLPDVIIPFLAQYIAMYSQARVSRSSVIVQFTNIEATFSKDVGITQLPLDQMAGVTPTSTVYLAEQPRTVSAYLGPLSSSKSYVKLMNSGTTASASGTGLTITAQNDVIQTSSLTSPPFEEWNWNIWTQNVSGAGTTETAGTNMRIMLYYTMEFYNRKMPSS